jgi:Transglutaminase-like superfamily
MDEAVLGSTMPIEQVEAARQMGRHIARIANKLPWQPSCLAQAFTGLTMLQRKHIQARLNLGVKRDVARQLAAHAWVTCGPIIVIGAQQAPDYVAVSVYSNATAAENS